MRQTDEILYPDSDGLPIAENTIQFRWIAIVMWNAAALFHDRPDVFVAGDHLIYPVEGQPEIRSAPDAYVAFGVPNRDRGSYKVWQEGGIFPHVVFEVWSPGNRKADFDAKLAFYDKYGAEEYYLVDPEGHEDIFGWRREQGCLTRIPTIDGFVSPRLGFRFTHVERRNQHRWTGRQTAHRSEGSHAKARRGGTSSRRGTLPRRPRPQSRGIGTHGQGIGTRCQGSRDAER